VVHKIQWVGLHRGKGTGSKQGGKSPTFLRKKSHAQPKGRPRGTGGKKKTHLPRKKTEGESLIALARQKERASFEPKIEGLPRSHRSLEVQLKEEREERKSSISNSKKSVARGTLEGEDGKKKRGEATATSLQSTRGDYL